MGITVRFLKGSREVTDVQVMVRVQDWFWHGRCRDLGPLHLDERVQAEPPRMRRRVEPWAYRSTLSSTKAASDWTVMSRWRPSVGSWAAASTGEAAASTGDLPTPLMGRAFRAADAAANGT